MAKFRAEGVEPEIRGLNTESEAIVRRLAIYDKAAPIGQDAGGHP
jgi:hypothetical protein